MFLRTTLCGSARRAATDFHLPLSGMSAAHGSVFAAQARFARSDVIINGTSSEYLRVGDEGPGAHFHFCPTCGTTVYCIAVGKPDEIAIPVGAFADPDFPAPQVSVYEERKHAWVGAGGHRAHCLTSSKCRARDSISEQSSLRSCMRRALADFLRERSTSAGMSDSM